MKRATIQLFAIFFLLITGCSKEKMVTEPKENNVLKKGGTAGNTEINFECVSTLNNNFIDLAPGYLVPVRQILKQGLFAGTLNGYGIISSRQSPYEITSYELLPNDFLYDPIVTAERQQYLDYPDEPLMYKITIEGKIILNPQDYCSVRIEGIIYPVCYVPIVDNENGEFEGTGVFHSGTRKLAYLNGKKLRVYGQLWGYGVVFYQSSSSTGKLQLKITDNLVIN